MKLRQIVLAVAISAIALPVSAAQTPSAQKAEKPAGADQKKYCLQYDDTVGSRVRQTQCKTKAAWARQGVDVDEQVAKRD